MYHNKDYEDEIDLKDLLLTLLNYKKSIFIFIILGIAISGYIAYFKPNIYQAQTLIKITFDKQGYYDDFLMVSPSTQNSEIEDELIVLQSTPIAQKTIKKLNIGTRYFTTKGYKEIEFYQNAPFSVSYTYISPLLYGKKFIIRPLGDKEFILELDTNKFDSFMDNIKSIFKNKQSNKQNISFYKICKYGENIQNDLFVLKVDKIYNLNNKHYAFSIMPNKYMTWFIQQGIHANALSKYSSIVSLTFYDTVPLRASDIANAVAQAYIEQNLELKSKGAKKQLHFIDMQLDAINKTLQGSSKKLQKYKATNIVVNLSNKANITANKLSSLESQKYEIDMQLEILKSMLSHLQHTNSIKKLKLDYTPTTNKSISSLIEQIQIQLAKYSTMSVHYTVNHPGVIKLKREILFLVKSLKQTIKSNIGILKKQKNLILHSIKEQEKRLKNVPKQEQELESLTRHFMVNEKIYSYLLEKRAETAILASSTISNTRIIQKATSPSSPIKPRRKLIVMVGIILGIIFGILQALIRKYFDNTIKTQEDIQKNTTLPIYATLPLIKQQTSLPHYMEAVRTLWVNISFLGDHKISKVISITSSISGEGKTFSIYNLSKVIASSTSKKVIVIDMDMRRSSLHKKFNIDSDNKGLSTLLSEHFGLDDVIKHTAFENLDIITSGPKAPNPTRLIMSEHFSTFIEELKKRYDYILVDTPPIGIVSDSMKIMHISDLVLYVIKADYSSNDVFKIINDLNKTNKINFGIVLNGVDFEKSYYHYGYKSEYTQYYIKKEENDGIK